MKSVLDQYIEKQTSQPVVARLNQGHRMLCPKCKTFQRHEATIDKDDLSITYTCRTCGTFDRFVLTKFGYVEQGLRKRLREFAYQRAVEELIRLYRKTK